MKKDAWQNDEVKEAVDGGNASKVIIAAKSEEVYCTFSIEKNKGCNQCNVRKKNVFKLDEKD